MSLTQFIGREYELERLNDLLHKKTASLVVINGRRRIGKSRLIEEFARNKPFFYFSGLAPDKHITAQDQRNEFSIQLGNQTTLPAVQADDWSKLFQLLAEKVASGRIILVFDEITWMAHDDPTFLSKLKNAWDLHFKKNSKLIFIICGSISAWIERNILSSTGYFGRVSLHLTLSELPIHSCGQLLDSLGFKRSNIEKLMCMLLTGGVPWYLEQMLPHLSAEENIKRLCFEPQALLLNEFKYIFHDLFGRRGDIYEKIVKLLVQGPLDYQKISEKLNYSKGSALSDYLEELIMCGYVRKDHTWVLGTKKQSSLFKYRLSDNFLRFYLKFMQPKLNLIKEGKYQDIYLSDLAGWWGTVGLQIENLVLNNRNRIIKELSINPLDIIADGPYFQTPTLRTKGCQIDYLIQTKMNNLFACEIKFSQNAIGKNIIKEMQEKIAKLSVPLRHTVLPVLIHCNEVGEAVQESEYFYRIIDFSKFLLPQA